MSLDKNNIGKVFLTIYTVKLHIGEHSFSLFGCK